MECSAKIIRERKEYERFPHGKTKTLVQVYCPLFGEIVLSGEQAEKAIKNIRELEGRKSF